MAMLVNSVPLSLTIINGLPIGDGRIQFPRYPRSG
jgi:hypothetical protein